MTWQGYWTYDGTEIINVARVEAYAADEPWFLPLFKNPVLADMLDETYAATTGAPWYDPDIAASADFLGVYPLDVVGSDSSSRTSAVVEYTTEGGSPGRVRNATKAIVFNCVLMARSPAGLDYGKRWLGRALLGGLCSDNLATQSSSGLELGYLSSNPVLIGVEDAEEALSRFQRFRHEVVFNVGPTVTAEWDLACGAAACTVTFTAVAGSPFEIGADRPLLQGFLDPSVINPWVPGITPGTADSVGYPRREVECGVDVWAPIFDPECPALIAPPAPASIPLGCFDLGDDYVPLVLTNSTRNPRFFTNNSLWTIAGTGLTLPRTATAPFSDGADTGGAVTLGTAIPLVTIYPTGTGAPGANMHPTSVGSYLHGRIEVRAAKACEVKLALEPMNGTTPLTALPDTGWLTMAINQERTLQLPDKIANQATTNGYRPVLYFRNTGGSGNITTGILAYIRRMASYSTTVAQGWTDVPYFDGDTVDANDYVYAFTGTAHASTSTRTDNAVNWTRRIVTIPANQIPLWDEVVPIVTLTSGDEIVRNARVRFYRNPDGDFDPDDDPCAFIGDMLISYIPENSTMVVDGTDETVFVTTDMGQRRRADSLVFQTDGTPFEWPALSCGYGWVVTVDTIAGGEVPVLDLALVPRAA